MRIWTRKSASIQPRTSLEKSAVSRLAWARMLRAELLARERVKDALVAEDVEQLREALEAAEALGLQGIYGGVGERLRAEQSEGHSTLSEARSRLDRRRFSRPNTHFLAFFKIYKKITFSRANFANFC